MRTKICVVCAAIVGVIVWVGPSEAAHFQETGTSALSYAESLTVTLEGTCNWEWEGGTDTLTIAPDPGENIGDEVRLSWCVDAVAEAQVTGPGYSAVGGVGGTGFTVDCTGWTNPNPATVVLNPGPGEQTIFTYGPEEVMGGDPPLTYRDCSSISVEIGDVIESNGFVFALVQGPGASSGTYVTLTYGVDIRLLTTGIPTQDTWGVVLLSLLIGLWTCWYLVKFRT
jgi:hypothetical protein